jgi:hypothetical protein
MDGRKPQRIIPGKFANHVKTRIEPSLMENTPENILASAMSIVAMEIVKLQQKSSRTSLDQKDARILQGYIKSMVELSREQRERDRSDDLSKLSTDELAKIAAGMLKKEVDTIEVEEAEDQELEDEQPT